ncbi:hypothetical protein [Pectinatus frisingensis]|uniref:hypothetical protein n=1 Tax=Pectinatus frisingensis TaxID=865 RepID=UPI0018C62565|nr:hypothetical protein [Pectinatus frisingensis]
MSKNESISKKPIEDVNILNTISVENIILTAPTKKIVSPAEAILNKNAEINKDLHVSETKINLQKYKKPEHINKSANYLFSNLLADSKVAAADPKIDTSTAVAVQTGITYQISNFTAGNQLLVSIDTNSIGKLSALYQCAATVDAEVYIFDVATDNSVNVIAYSRNILSDFDIVSCLPNGKTYYVLINVISGGGNIAFSLINSANYSASEPNDSPYQAVLKHEEICLYDTFDNQFDSDYTALEITNPEPVSIFLGFHEKGISGTVTFGIFQKTDGDNKPINKWISYQSLTVPTTTPILWNNNLKGTFYILVQCNSTNILNHNYALSFTPVSKLQIPKYLTTGDVGMTGIDYGRARLNVDGYPRYYPWVKGSFKVITNIKNNHEQVNLLADGSYPCFPIRLILVGLDANGKPDVSHNSNLSEIQVSNPDGHVTLSALLPATYGTTGGFNGHAFDYNYVYFYFITYDKDAQNPLQFRTSNATYVEFSPFLNVV